MAGETSTPPSLTDLQAVWRGSIPPFERDSFLALSPERRATAISRVEGLEALVARPGRPSPEEQRSVAKTLGLSMPRLQALMREWSKNRSIAVAAPYGFRKPQARSKAPGHQVARRIIKKALASDPDVAEPTLSSRIRSICEHIGVKPPARMTVRTLLEEARREMAPKQHSTPIDSPDPPNELFVRGPGDRLILADQIFEATIVDEDGTVAPAYARLLADLATGFILGATTERDLASLAGDVSRTLLETTYHLGRWLRPRTVTLVADLTHEEETQLAHEAEKLGIGIERELRRKTIRFQRVLSTGFAHIPPVRPQHRREESARSWPRLTREEFAHLLAVDVDHHREAVQRIVDQEPVEGAGGQEELHAALARLLQPKQ